jgi:hypothetical protein
MIMAIEVLRLNESGRPCAHDDTRHDRHQVGNRPVHLNFGNSSPASPLPHVRLMATSR